MKNKFLLSLLSIALITSCKVNGKTLTLKSIELSGDYQTTFTINEDFNYEGLVVTANYSDNTSKAVADYEVSTPDMSVIGNQDVTVTYKNKTKSYTITISSNEEVHYPVGEAIKFLGSRGLSVSSDIIPSTISNLSSVLSFEVIDDVDYPHFQVTAGVDNFETTYQTILSELNELHYITEDVDIFIDKDETIGLEIYENKGDLTINLYAYCDLIEIPPEEDDGEIREIDFPLQNSGFIAKEDNLNGKSYTFSDFTFAFSKSSGTTNPKSEKSNYVALYTSNTMTISSKYAIKEIAFTLYEGTDKVGPVTSDVGSVTNHVWIGNNKSITFTAVAQYRFSNAHIKYLYKEDPVIEGVKTIAEIYDWAKDYEYTPSSTGWYLTSQEVTIKIKAIDAIDSVTTSGLPANSRGKVLCVDETGYIIVSSGVSKSNPIDFYQRVKDYIKAGTTTYIVTGKIAFLNDVVEVNVTSYQYDSTLEINYDLNEYLSKDTVNNSDTLMNHCRTIKTNKNGYGVGELVRLNGLTCFNKYRKAGSYYFLDRDSKLVSIYSLLDKDRSSLILGNTYDIIGLESLYNGRPSLRILEVIRSKETPVDFDLESAVNKENTRYFYNINLDNSSYLEEYYQSAITVYKMDVYVSRYTDDKYTFNISYHYDAVNKEYTTGNSQVDASRYYSLAMSNESLDYNQTFYDYALELAESEEDIEQYKVTIYFTLALLDTVDGREMWKANVFEDYVPQLGA